MNDELVTRAASGDEVAQDELWKEVRRFCFMIANRYKDVASKNAGVDDADLEQMAALGFMMALKNFKPEKGSFLGWCKFYVMRTCCKGLGLTGRFRREFYNTISIYQPIEEDSDQTIEDTIADDSARTEADIVEEMYMADILESALNRLQDRDRRLIEGLFLHGKSAEYFADEFGILRGSVYEMKKRVLLKLKRDKILREQWRYPDSVFGTGLHSFRRNWASCEELYVIRHDENL